jgi:phage/plasmid-associated DNA primase
LHEVPPELRNENPARELVQEEGPAILAWIVAGAQAFIAKGLDDPGVVMTATTEYAQSEDHVQLFIDDCCERRPLAEQTEFSEVYKRYATWCKDNGIDKLAAAVFGRELGAKGFGKERDKAKRYVTGIFVGDPPKVTTEKFFSDWTDKYES